ncbi:MAG: DMT family transporter [Herbinix sp.]|nr:DMT family transporter [Herbinix sp.]
MILSPQKKYNIALAVAPWSMLISVCIWGLGYVITKVTLDGEISPMLLTAVSYTYGAIGSIPILIWKRKELVKKGILKEGAVLGIILFLSRLIQVFGCSYSTAGKNAFITATYVIIVPILMWIIMKEKLMMKSIVTAVITLIGIGLVSMNEQLNGINIGDVMTLVAGAGFALHIAYNGKYAGYHDPWILAGLQLVFAALFSIAAVFITQTPITPAFFTLQFQGCMIYNGILGMTVGFAFQSFGQKYVSQSKSAMILSLEAVSGALFSIVLLKERFGIKTVLGCLLIFVAIMISTYQFMPSVETESN